MLVDLPVLVLDLDAAVLQLDGDAEVVLEPMLQALPQLPRPEARVLELLDQGRDVVALEPEDRQSCLPEGEVLDPLRRPEGADLGPRDAPELLRVGAEEGVVEALAEARGHPVLERLRLLAALALRPDVGERTAERLPEPEPAEDVLRRERVREILAGVVDAGEPRPGEEVVPHQVLPHPLDLLQLREEAMPTQVEAVAVELDRLGDPADGAVGLEDDGGVLAQRECVGTRQTRRAPAEHRVADRFVLDRARRPPHSGAGVLALWLLVADMASVLLAPGRASTARAGGPAVFSAYANG